MPKKPEDATDLHLAFYSSIVLKMNFFYQQRNSSPKITEYLCSVINHIKPIDYYIDAIFNPIDLNEMLNEDLPSRAKQEDQNFFIQDIVDLCSNFLKQSTSKQLRLQLEVVRTNKCLLFHADNIKQRLLCTYLGPGTEWSEDCNVKREWLGKGCNEKVIIDNNQVKRANEFDILVLKGNLYQDKMSGVVHRSPPIEKRKEIRVLLKIDEI